MQTVLSLPSPSLPPSLPLSLPSPPPQDSTKEQGLGFQQVSIDDILEAQRVKQEAREEERRKRDVILQARGMRPQDKTEDAYS